MAKKPFRFTAFVKLIRALFPRWSFFDRVAHSYEFQFKIPLATNWQVIEFAERRKPLGLFVNPRINLALAEANLVEHFVSDVGDIQDEKGMIDSARTAELSSFRMLCSHLKVQLANFDVAKTSVQFKIVAVTVSERSDLYISEWLNLGER